jgi:hypothetical protein
MEMKSGSKKTLYEILEVSPTASFAEIQDAHLEATRKLQAENTGLSAERRDLELKLVRMAFQTLSNEKTRQAYGSRLNPQTALVVAPTAAGPEVWSLKAEAASLKADAATLMAEAAMLKADALLQTPTTPYKIAAAAGKSFRFVFTALGGIVAFIMVLVVAFVWGGAGGRLAADEDAKAKEKIMIQEYYQTHGVRPKNKIELELLEAENQRQAKAEREAAREKQKEQSKEREYERSVEESRRLGQQVSDRLRADQERAEREARREAERKAEEQRRKEEAELERIRRERARIGLH